MKKIFLYTGLLLMIATTAGAQVKKDKVAETKKASITRKVPQKGAKAPAKNILINHGTYQAKNSTAPVRTLTVSDPTVKIMNSRAQGQPVPFNAKAILGVPKITYGLGHGQLLFRSRGATTSGTSTGSGLVGTGSGLGPLGASGLSLGVNGKSPYAGPIMDGIIVTGLPAGNNNTEAAIAPKRKRKQ